MRPIRDEIHGRVLTLLGEHGITPSRRPPRREPTTPQPAPTGPGRAGRGSSSENRAGHPDVVYVGPDGSALGRSQDLEAHSSGALRLTRVEQLHGAAWQLDSAGITRVHVQVAGVVSGEPFEAEMAHTHPCV